MKPKPKVLRDTPVTVFFEKEQAVRIRVLSAKLNQSRSEFIRRIIENYIKTEVKTNVKN